MTISWNFKLKCESSLQTVSLKIWALSHISANTITKFNLRVGIIFTEDIINVWRKLFRWQRFKMQWNESFEMSASDAKLEKRFSRSFDYSITHSNFVRFIGIPECWLYKPWTVLSTGLILNDIPSKSFAGCVSNSLLKCFCISTLFQHLEQPFMIILISKLSFISAITYYLLSIYYYLLSIYY